MVGKDAKKGLESDADLALKREMQACATKPHCRSPTSRMLRLSAGPCCGGRDAAAYGGTHRPCAYRSASVYGLHFPTSHRQVRRKELKKFQEEEERFAKLNRCAAGLEAGRTGWGDAARMGWVQVPD